MNLDGVLIGLHKGQSVTFTARGGSMKGKIENGEEVTVDPLPADAEIAVGDIVLARVQGQLFLHLVTAIANERVQISNNKGHVNGWTKRNKVFGRVKK